MSMKPRMFAIILCAFPVLTVSVSPALAWWQFVALGDNGERKVYTRFSTEASCQAALKAVETKLKQKYPKRFPLVGSCEEYR
jgi:hypothetical protein